LSLSAAQHGVVGSDVAKLKTRGCVWRRARMLMLAVTYDFAILVRCAVCIRSHSSFIAPVHLFHSLFDNKNFSPCLGRALTFSLLLCPLFHIQRWQTLHTRDTHLTCRLPSVTTADSTSFERAFATQIARSRISSHGRPLGLTASGNICFRRDSNANELGRR
jgi:hypothetical protein